MAGCVSPSELVTLEDCIGFTFYGGSSESNALTQAREATPVTQDDFYKGEHNEPVTRRTCVFNRYTSSNGSGASRQRLWMPASHPGMLPTNRLPDLLQVRSTANLHNDLQDCFTFEIGSHLRSTFIC